MTLREDDLQNTVLKKVSIDEFEPKTGKSENVMVLGFHVNDQHPGKDLYKYLNNSIHEIRDVEVSPNPNEDGFYMVFLEIDRKEGVLDVVKDIVKEVENLSGKLKWNISTPLAEELIDLTDDRLANYIQQNEGQFLSKQEFDQIQVEAQQVEEEKRLEEEAQSNTGKILEFLQDSNLLEAGINDGKLVMRGARDVATLEVVNFGHGPDVMNQLGISESAIKTDFDKTTFDKFNSMLGEMKAIPIDEYVIIYNPAHKDILITRPTV